MARVIRAVMPEYGARGPGFAIEDTEVDGAVVGGGGVGPLWGGEEGTCELRKMYLLPAARGLGAGKALLARCIEEARERGYRRMYLETLTGMDAAQRLYERFGFRRLGAPMGATGHFGCDRWYSMEL